MQSITVDPYSDVRYVDMNIEFKLLDTNAQSAATPSVSGSEDVSQLSQLTDDNYNMGAKYATLEDDLWSLDGTCDLLPDSVSGIQTGWWSDVLSGSDKTFSSSPTLTFDFGVAISTIGFTMYFDDKQGQYPTSIKVTTYGSDGTTITEQETHSNDSTTCIIDMAVEDYYSVTFEFLETSEPYRRIKMVDCRFGIVQIFNKDNLVSATMEYETTIDSSALASNELTFKFDNNDHKYNLLNPSGLYAYLQDGQEIICTCIVNGEDINMGTFYYTEAQAKDNAMTAEITANDLILSIDEDLYNNGATGTWTLSTAVTAVLSGTGIAANYDGTLGDTTVNKCIPLETSKREALRLLAQAAKCSCWIDRDGILQFKELTVDTSVDTLTADRLKNYGGVSVGSKVNKVELIVADEFAETENTYTSGSGKNVVSVDNPCAYDGAGVASWLLLCYNRRVEYTVANRGNPAVELSDTITIYDAYGENNDATITGITLKYTGGLSATTKAVGE